MFTLCNSIKIFKTSEIINIKKNKLYQKYSNFHEKYHKYQTNVNKCHRLRDFQKRIQKDY